MSANRIAPYLAESPTIESDSALKSRTAPLLSVVIVNYCRWAETANLVEQLIGEPGLFRDQLEVLVIDNHSPEDVYSRRLRRTPGVRIFRMSRNRGFSAAVNEGQKRTRGRWMLVMNPDLSVDPAFVDQVCATALDFESVSLDGTPVGVVGFQLRNPDGSRQLSTGLFPSLGRMIRGLFHPRAVRKYQPVQREERHRVPWVTGSCLLLRRACLKRLGGFDERFFLYYEDVDLCRRAQQHGWAVCYDPSVRAAHLDPLQNREVTVPMRVITRHAALAYFHKHLPGWPSRWLSRIIRMEAWLRQKWAGLKGRTADAILFRKLRGICRDLDARRSAKARHRLEEVLKAAKMN